MYQLRQTGCTLAPTARGRQPSPTATSPQTPLPSSLPSLPSSLPKNADRIVPHARLDVQCVVGHDHAGWFRHAQCPCLQGSDLLHYQT
mmetsp:Transcript_53213/g.124690  ORF Transcript_53213/g.124690 Transcript_53213/m.124690 type:complete len:88 (-) Transcript_53213:673-936(-)